MKLFFSLIFIIFTVQRIYCQKPPIDTSAVTNWPTLNNSRINPAISNDGSYFAYTIENFPFQSSTVVVESTSSPWKKEIEGVSRYTFTEDSKQFIYQCVDSLYFLSLETNILQYIVKVRSFKQSSASNGEWFAYLLNNDLKELVLIDKLTGKERHFNSVVDYYFCKNGNVLLLQTETKENDLVAKTLQWVELTDNKVITIWASKKNSEVCNYCFNDKGNKFAFIIQQKRIDHADNSIWFYQAGMDSAVERVNNQSPGIDSGLSIYNRFLRFSKNGNWLFLSLQYMETRNPKSNYANVDVWSYRDKILQSAQLKDPGPKNFQAVINVNSNEVRRLEQVNEKATLSDYFGNDLEDFVIINDNEFGSPFTVESWWNVHFPKTYYLVSLKDGTRTLLTKALNPFFIFSPEKKYIVYYDRVKRNYFSYDVAMGKTINLSRDIPTKLYFENDDKLNKRNVNMVGIAKWLENSWLLIYDYYDIWKVDAKGENRPINITNGFGRSHRIIFKLVNAGTVKDDSKDNGSLLLTAFNTVNKHNGFYRKSLNESGDPEMLTMGPYSLYRIQHSNPLSNEIELNIPFRPLKAKYSNAWVVQRMTASEAPNYFLTKDFKAYSPLSNIQPHKGYNWLTATLINWKQLDGTMNKGILYKPENFNPAKKYPIIFYYYEVMSDRLYEYPKAEYIKGGINIPWFVSRDYLVFTPDIHYTIGKTGQSAYNSIISAAKYLSKKAYVDKNKMGLQGHSFGGFETNYLVTHSHSFAAAAEAAGMSNIISDYGSIRVLFGTSTSVLYEEGLCRLDVTLWQRPDLYIENSPIFKVDQVTTPLLIMHNSADKNVSWSQGLELYTALRRLGKKCWLLQYDNEDHNLSDNSNAAKDYTIRLTQFFNHYLKGEFPPKWMTEGVPAYKKGIEDGLELDLSGRKP